MPKVLTVSDIAKELKIGKNTAYELVKEPGFPCFKIQKSVRTTLEALNEWMNKQIEKEN